jgi:ABC-type nitrate/sulfonate/bicarbonate transport system substrate-binding protein
MSATLKLGFIPLNDAAPLIVAKANGFFEAEGLDVALSREASWATVRDKVVVGALDGAHMLAPLAIAASLGVGGEKTPLVVPMALNLSGSAFTVSKALAAAVRDIDPDGSAARSAQGLARVIAARRARGEGVLTFGVVYPYSTHNYQLRYWLADAGIDPDHDVRLVVVPPPRTAEQLRAGVIDGFCVGAPWGVQAVAEGAGEILAYSSDIWRGAPDKGFGVTGAWAQGNPDTLQALIRALIRGAQWADTPANRPELAALLARPEHVGAPQAVVAELLSDAPQGLAYHRHAAGFPWRSHAAWFGSQMLRWGQAQPSEGFIEAATAVYQPDLYRTAARSLGLSSPSDDSKLEGAHARPWRAPGSAGPLDMAADGFCDGRVFNPAAATAYAAGFTISRTRG